MKVIFIFFSFSLYSQSIKILSAKDTLSIEGSTVSINKKVIAVSNENGIVLLKKSLKKTLEINHLSYEKLFMEYNFINDTTIYLEPKNEILEEVELKNCNKITLKPERKFFSIDFNTNIHYNNDFEIAIYIPNNYRVNCYIDKIMIPINKTTFNKSVFAPIKVNLLKPNLLSEPSEPYFKDNIIISKNKENEFIEIKFNENIPFEKEGVFLYISFFRTKYYIDNGFIYSPSFKALFQKKKSNFKEFYRLGTNDSWKEFSYSKYNKQVLDLVVFLCQK